MIGFHGKLCLMSKPAQATEILPVAVARALKDLGENLALARQRRNESQRAWASRLSVSVPTLIRMEKGDPSVGMGVYATALWLMGRHAALPEVAAPAQDLNALEQDIEAVRQRSKRLSRKPKQVL
jgi:transcriptional regulator with XRE-family HTH domain